LKSIRSALVCLLALLALAACDRPKPRTVPPDPMAQPAATAVVQPLVEGRTASLRKRTEYPAAYLDHLGAATDPLKNRPAVTPAGAAIKFDGFGYDGVAGAPAKGIEVVVDSKAYVAEYGKPRADVMDFTKNPALGNTGYSLVLPPGALTPGPHMVRVRVIASDGASYYEIPPIPFTAQ
jgi:hypothetical protein